MFELVREEETDIIVWLVGIIQGKATVDGFDGLVAIERDDNIHFRPTDNKKYDW